MSAKAEEEERKRAEEKERKCKECERDAKTSCGKSSAETIENCRVAITARGRQMCLSGRLPDLSVTDVAVKEVCVDARGNKFLRPRFFGRIDTDEDKGPLTAPNSSEADPSGRRPDRATNGSRTTSAGLTCHREIQPLPSCVAAWVHGMPSHEESSESGRRDTIGNQWRIEGKFGDFTIGINPKNEIQWNNSRGESRSTPATAGGYVFCADLGDKALSQCFGEEPMKKCEAVCK